MTAIWAVAVQPSPGQTCSSTRSTVKTGSALRHPAVQPLPVVLPADLADAVRPVRASSRRRARAWRSAGWRCSTPPCAPGPPSPDPAAPPPRQDLADEDGEPALHGSLVEGAEVRPLLRAALKKWWCSVKAARAGCPRLGAGGRQAEQGGGSEGGQGQGEAPVDAGSEGPPVLRGGGDHRGQHDRGPARQAAHVLDAPVELPLAGVRGRVPGLDRPRTGTSWSWWRPTVTGRRCRRARWGRCSSASSWWRPAAARPTTTTSPWRSREVPRAAPASCLSPPRRRERRAPLSPGRDPRSAAQPSESAPRPASCEGRGDQGGSDTRRTAIMGT